jgi:hypothetical protein
LPPELLPPAEVPAPLVVVSSLALEQPAAARARVIKLARGQTEDEGFLRAANIMGFCAFSRAAVHAVVTLL